ncbi:MAG: 23S rRNA (pseudouridine(1915)-N(3))-methyltransferase RlmH, partial [Dongiaceae bacterium]
EQELFDSYRRRLKWPLALHEVEERRKLPPAELIAREGELLLAGLPSGGDGRIVVAMDERGKRLGSAAFARQLAAWRGQGIADLAFLIGGADGLSDRVRGHADLLLSLGEMTWPHLLARAMLAEQLYRAQAILAGHPYHRA